MLRGDVAVESVAFDDQRFPSRFTVGLEDIDGLDGIVVASLAVRNLDILGSLHNHLGEELGVCSNKF